MIPIVVITHGLFGQEMVRTAEDIVGHQDSVVAIPVTSETGSDHLSQRIDEVLSASGPDGALILVDMMGGTPCNVSLLKSKQFNVEIVTGVNLYILISAFRHRGEGTLKALATQVAEDGRRAILLPKELLFQKKA